MPTAITHSASPALARPRCTVCDAPVFGPPGAAAARTVCVSAPCRTVMAAQARLSPVAFRHHLLFHRENLRAQQAARAEKAELVQAQAAAEAVENAQQLQALAAHLPPGGVPAPVTVTMVLPSGPRRELRLTQRRRAAYRKHLYHVLRTLRADPSAGTTLLPTPSAPLVDDPHGPMRERLCGVCAGGCCTAAGERAYLTPDTMRRVMAEHPGLGMRAIVALYLSRLASHTQAGSCINHTKTGCSLPRELRSDTCNNYLCESQKRLTAAAPNAVALVVLRRQNQWDKSLPGYRNDVIGSACVSASGVHEVLPLPATLNQAPR